VRLILINTPEVFGGVQGWGSEASVYRRARLLGQTVRLEKGLFNEQIVRHGFVTLATSPLPSSTWSGFR
jgi:hypothetical protein